MFPTRTTEYDFILSRDFIAFCVISCGFVDRVFFWAGTIHEFTRTQTE